MARREKNSRIKFLPPFYQGVEKASRLFDFPTKLRTSSDGRNGLTNFAFDESIALDFSTHRMWPLWNGTTGLVAAYRFNKQTFNNNTTTIYPVNSGSAHRKITFTGNNAHPGRETPFPFEQNGYSLFLSSSTYGVINDPTNAFSFGDGAGSDVAFSISLWFRPELSMNSSTSTVLIGKFNNAGSTIEWYIHRTSNQIYLYLFNGANYIAGYSTSGVFVEGEWSHLVITYAGTSVASGIKIYRNAEPVAMSTASGGSYTFMVPSVLNTVKICELNGAERFNGHIDHLMVWRSVVLTANEVFYLYKHFASEGGLQAATRMPDDSLYNQYELRTDLIINNASPSRGFTDSLIFKNLRTEKDPLTPFREHDRPQLDGMTYVSSSGIQKQEFYATGSKPEDVGINFNSPLWSKSVIEIDISTPTPSEFGIKRVSGDDYSMAYYDFGTKSYRGIGSRKRIAEYGSDPLTKYIKEKAVGFFNSYMEDFSVIDFPEFCGKKGDSFGFPYSQQYYVPRSSSCLYPLSGVLAEPFLLEKIVVSFSGSFRNNGYRFPEVANGVVAYPITNCWTTVSTFFILNQYNSGFMSESLSYRDNVALADRHNASIHRSGSIDLITYSQILCVSASTTERAKPYFAKLLTEFEKVIDFQAVSTTSSSFGYSGKFILSSSVKMSPPSNLIGIYSFSDAIVTGYYGIKADKGNRNGRGKVCGRNWKSNFVGTVPSSQSYATPLVTDVSIPNKKHIVCPYILLPTDNLIFGWQVPESGQHKASDTDIYLWSSGENTGPTLYFSGSAKVTLFGSHIKVGDDGEYIESHDTLNQLLSSVTINEVIG